MPVAMGRLIIDEEKRLELRVQSQKFRLGVARCFDFPLQAQKLKVIASKSEVQKWKIRPKLKARAVRNGGLQGSRSG